MTMPNESEVRAEIVSVQSRLDALKRIAIQKQVEVDFMVQEIRELQGLLDGQKANLAQVVPEGPLWTAEDSEFFKPYFDRLEGKK